MSAQVDAELFLVKLLRDQLPSVTVNIQHAPTFLDSPAALQVRALPGGVIYRHAQVSHYDVELVGWSNVDRATARSVCARAHEALREAWLRQTKTSAPGALANYQGGQAPYHERLPGMPDTTYRYSSTASLGVRT